MGIISGAWKNTVFVCGNHTDEKNLNLPVMEISAGPRSLSYICPKCNPLNRAEGEAKCCNEISLNDYEKAIQHLSDKIIEAEDNDEQLCLLHHKWKRKTMNFEVIEHKNDRLVVKFIDSLAIKKG
ncbi:MAG: hypothetical protein IJY88_01480 [Clostridia bacterium]|nr:hypothetical protein [Clostridia bacterium]